MQIDFANCLNCASLIEESSIFGISSVNQTKPINFQFAQTSQSMRQNVQESRFPVPTVLPNSGSSRSTQQIYRQGTRTGMIFIHMGRRVSGKFYLEMSQAENGLVETYERSMNHTTWKKWRLCSASKSYPVPLPSYFICGRISIWNDATGTFWTAAVSDTSQTNWGASERLLNWSAIKPSLWNSDDSERRQQFSLFLGMTFEGNTAENMRAQKMLHARSQTCSHFPRFCSSEMSRISGHSSWTCPYAHNPRCNSRHSSISQKGSSSSAFPQFSFHILSIATVIPPFTNASHHLKICSRWRMSCNVLHGDHLRRALKERLIISKLLLPAKHGHFCDSFLWLAKPSIVQNSNSFCIEKTVGVREQWKKPFPPAAETVNGKIWI
jgi:hypothetical protein